jgi:hypothetical protein
MFIVWGKKHVYRKLGYVADFCPICRDTKGFLMRRVGLAGHLYYISVGEGDLVGHERTCETCKTSFHADIGLYAAVSKKAASFNQLQQETYPNLPVVNAARLALEEKVRNTPALLTAAERQGLILAPFTLLSPKVEKQYAETNIDKETGFAIVGMLALLAIGPAIAGEVFPDSTDAAVLTCLAVGVMFVGWQVATSGRRFMRRKIIPVLAQALHPLNPTEAEMRSVLEDMKRLKHRMGVKLKLADLMAQLQSLSTPR